MAFIEGYKVEKTLSEMLQELREFTRRATSYPDQNGRRLYQEDVSSVVAILNELSDYNTQIKDKPLSNEGDSTNVWNIASDLLQPANIPLWRALQKVCGTRADLILLAMVFRFPAKFVKVL